MAAATEETERPSSANTSALWTGVLLGIGLMGAVDTIVFHQFLQWHHFYVHASEYWRIFSDGVIHTFTTSLLLASAVRLWWERRHTSRLLRSTPLWAGGLLGAGGFQLFDGIINHKVLQLHPVREGVEHLLLYDIGWNAFGLVLLAAGYLLWRRTDADGVQVPD